MQIQVKNISKHFSMFKRDPGLYGAFRSFFNRNYEEFHALKSIDLDINKGEIVGILGENGAGKTTLIKLMIGLIYPSGGSLSINGYNPSDRKPDFLKTISVVMGQKNQLWWDIPASESFLLNQKIYDIDSKSYNKTLDELVDLFDVHEKINVQVRKLSLGERMKMEIIASLLHQPKIVLLDEPTIGLDVISQSKIREFVKYYREQYSTTFILTSHYMSDIKALCKRVAVLHKGEKLYDGDFDYLISKVNPPKRLIFEFSSEVNLDEVNSIDRDLPIKISDRVLTCEVSESGLTTLLDALYDIDKPTSVSIEDLPVEDTMRNFFNSPKKFLDA